MYISYDGMSDPLGQSQVIPYLKGLTKKGYQFALLSFEKLSAFQQRKDAIRRDLASAGIEWYPLTYTKHPPVLSTLYDLWRMKRMARRIVKQQNIGIIHARSYIPAMVGLGLKKSLQPSSVNLQLLFDMRGFWADERVDGGLWRLSNPLYRWIYHYMKKQERLLLQQADHTISLTEAGKKIIQERKDIDPQPIPVTVIPTCVDTHRFDPSKMSDNSIHSLKEDLGISEDTFVLGYVGSTGTWYLLDEMLAFFKVLAQHKKAVFFLVTKDDPDGIYAKAEAQGIDVAQIIIRSAPYADVLKMIAVFDVGIFFIKPVYSKAASAPTKMGELLAMGKPIICNDGVGDVGDLVRKYGCGVVLNELNQTGYIKAIQHIDDLLKQDEEVYRQVSLDYFSLSAGVEKYTAVYENLLKQKGAIHYFIHHRPGRSPGQRFRCEQYVPYLEEAGFRINWHNLLDEADDRLFYSSGNLFQKARLVWRKWWHRWQEVRQVRRGDLVFIYRETYMLGTTFFERQLKKRGAKLIYDFDDAIWLMDVSEGNRKLAFLKRPGKTADICRLSDIVIVGNEYLANYARQYADQVAIIPTTIDTDYHRPVAVSHQKPSVCIGWTGSETTIKHFETILPVLEQIKTLYGDRVYFKLITNRPVNYPSLELSATMWNKAEEVEQLAEIDIGIMPLPYDDWSKGKCGFKLLQYMALEKPVVASPVGVNTDIVEHHQNGYLATTAEEWVDRLTALIDDAHLRHLLGARGRQKVVAKYSINSQREAYVRLIRALA